MNNRKNVFTSMVLSSILLTSFNTFTGCDKSNSNNEADYSQPIEITNVSYDPTRELYTAYNHIFTKYWKDKTGQDITITQSHGGSGSQARSVIEGNEADVVTLALEYDITAIENAGLIDDGWQSEFDLDSAPYTSTIVFLVRKDNPLGIKDWNDLVKDGIGVITPNPKTSGGARWNYLGAWAYADNLYNGDEVQIEKFIGDLYRNVLVLDSGARGATSTFVENGQGDVLIAWENEAYLTLEEYPNEYEIVTPSISILAQPSVAIVDEVVDDKGTREVSTEYLKYLYSDEAQDIIAQNYYRPTNETILNNYSDVFDLNIQLVTINDELFGGWDSTQEKHFADGGIFDQIYEG